MAKVQLESQDLAEVLKHIDMTNIGNDQYGKKTEAISRVFEAFARGRRKDKKKAADAEAEAEATTTTTT